MQGSRNSHPPLREIRSAVGRIILVKLKDGTECVGRLVAADRTMNLVLEDCVEVYPGTREPKTRYGLALVRGSQVVYVGTDYELVAGPA